MADTNERSHDSILASRDASMDRSDPVVEIGSSRLRES